MDQSPATSEPAFLDELRRRRSELRDSMSALELALAAPAPQDPARWAERVHVALVELTADFRVHVDLTEGPDGLYQELLRRAPRLSGAMARLTHDHARIRGLVEELLARVRGQEGGGEVDHVRELGTTLLGALVRHRQRGADLVFEAYQVDIGGET